MCFIRPIHLAVIVLLALTVLPNSFALADETITVQLVSGRTFTGLANGRTDRDRLWLRLGSLSVQILRPIAWEAIESISFDGAPIERNELLARIASADEESRPPEPADDPSAAISIEIKNTPTEVDYAAQAAAALDMQPRATHIDFYATLENWDADPQPDGLLLHVQLLDAQGRGVNASGSLQAELFAAVERRFQAVPHGRGTSVLAVARWSHAVRVEESQRGEHVVQLPFSAAQPVGNDLASSYGLLHVKLAVPGHGVFEDSYDGLTLRRFTPTRDLLERQHRRPTVFTEPPQRMGNVR